MSRSLARTVGLAALLLSQVALAQAVDPGAAREQLKQGYALKVEGKYAEALPHLVESLRLDPQVKTLMNLADTEEHVGKLVDATRHWVQARDKSGGAGEEGAREEATKRLAAAEARTPKLTIVLTGADSALVTVKRDSVLLGAVSLGTALPTDPGAHSILVEADGFASHTFEVTLNEGESRKIEVSPGPKLASPAPSAAASASASAAPVSSASAAPSAEPGSSSARPVSPSTSNVQLIAGLATAGIGVVLLAVSFGEFASAKSKHEDALTGCTAGICSADSFALQDDAKSAAKVGNVLAVVGGVLALGGGITALVAPRSSSDATSVVLLPEVGAREGRLTWRGSF